MVMSTQEIFDKAATHLMTQRKRSRVIVEDEFGDIDEDNSTCAYRKYPERKGGKVLMCAVGALIPDELYDPKLDMDGGNNVNSGLVKNVLRKAGVVSDVDIKKGSAHSERLNLLGQLQVIHDTNEPHEWLTELKHLAKRFELSDEVLKRFRSIKAKVES